MTLVKQPIMNFFGTTLSSINFPKNEMGLVCQSYYNLSFPSVLPVSSWLFMDHLGQNLVVKWGGVWKRETLEPNQFHQISFHSFLTPSLPL